MTSIQMSHRIPVWTLVIVALSLCAFLFSQFSFYESVIENNGDIIAYQRAAVTINAMRAGVKVDAPDYYPPFANILFLSAENNIWSLPFHRGLLMLFVVTAGIALMFIGMCVDERSLRWVILAVPASIALLEPAVFFARFDFFPMLMILLSCLCLRRRQYEFSGIFLMLGCMLKLAPVFLIPLLHVMVPQGKRKKFWLGMGVSAGIVIVISFFILGVETTIDSMMGFFRLSTAYAPYALSTASSIDLFIRMIFGGNGTIEWVAPDLGHFNTGLPVVISSALLFLSAAGALWIARIASHDSQRERNILLYSSAVMLWLLFATPLLTMHYYLWVLPLMFLWFLEETESRWDVLPWQGIVGLSAVAIALLGQWMYPTLYFDLVDRQTPIAVTVNFLRNGIVLLAVIACLQATKETRKRS